MAEYIEREAVLAMCDRQASIEWNKKAAPISWAHGYEIFAENIEAIPAADVAPVVHGRWYWVAYDPNPMIGNWHCSQCNRIPKSLEKEIYCPNCGAKMDLEGGGGK